MAKYWQVSFEFLISFLEKGIIKANASDLKSIHKLIILLKLSHVKGKDISELRWLDNNWSDLRQFRNM